MIKKKIKIISKVINVNLESKNKKLCSALGHVYNIDICEMIRII